MSTVGGAVAAETAGPATPGVRKSAAQGGTSGTTMTRTTAADIASAPFQEAREKEFQSMIDNKVFDIKGRMSPGEARKAGKTIIPAMWVNTWKQPDNLAEPRKAKARFVAIGLDKFDSRLIETFNGTPSLDEQRVILIWGVTHQKPMGFVDVKAAFLQAPCAEEDKNILIRMPKLLPKNAKEAGLVEEGLFPIKQALYGLKNSPRSFGLHFRRQVLEMGFQELGMSSYVRVRGRIPKPPMLMEPEDDKPRNVAKAEVTAALTHHVDDVMVVGDPEKELAALGNRLTIGTYLILKKGEMRRLVGMEVTWNQDSIVQSQDHYLDKEDFPVGRTTALTVDSFAPPVEADVDMAIQAEYRHKIGMMGWLTRTRIEVCYAFSELSRWCATPTPKLLRAVNRVLYHCKTVASKMVYVRVATPELRIWCDASYDLREKGGRSGWVVQLADAKWPLEERRNALTWGTKKEKRKLESTTAAELVASVRAVKAMGALLGPIDVFFGSVPVRMLLDNAAHVHQMKTGVCASDCSMQGNLNWIRQECERLRVRVERVDTKLQWADCLTKWLPSGCLA
ncbi:MAG: reverse transcriptase domain-containing protein [Candidatus Limnocylindrus sp.]